jgi:hypothetical protein
MTTAAAAADVSDGGVVIDDNSTTGDRACFSPDAFWFAYNNHAVPSRQVGLGFNHITSRSINCLFIHSFVPYLGSITHHITLGCDNHYLPCYSFVLYLTR